MNKKLSELLRYGVLTSGLLMLLGWLSTLDFNKKSLPSLSEYQTSASLVTILPQAIEQSQWGLLLSYAGLALLVALPVFRVFVTIPFFIKQNEKILAFAAAFVFVILIVNFAISLDF